MRGFPFGDGGISQIAEGILPRWRGIPPLLVVENPPLLEGTRNFSNFPAHEVDFRKLRGGGNSPRNAVKFHHHEGDFAHANVFHSELNAPVFPFCAAWTVIYLDVRRHTCLNSDLREVLVKAGSCGWPLKISRHQASLTAQGDGRHKELWQLCSLVMFALWFRPCASIPPALSTNAGSGRPSLPPSLHVNRQANR